VSVRQSNKFLRLIVASSWVFYLSLTGDNCLIFKDGTDIVLKYPQPTTNLSRGTYQKSEDLNYTTVEA
jgi:hypothetical protein